MAAYRPFTSRKGRVGGTKALMSTEMVNFQYVMLARLEPPGDLTVFGWSGDILGAYGAGNRFLLAC
jgi:hypothetical protein